MALLIATIFVATVVVVGLILRAINAKDNNGKSASQESVTPTQQIETKNIYESTAEEAEKLFQRAEALRLDEPETSFQLYLSAAKMGHVLAMTHVGAAYFTQGMGADFDPEQSAYWYEKAAEQGEFNSMINIARHYMSGVARREDDNKAKMWLQKATQASGGRYSRTAEIAKKFLKNYDETKISITVYMKSAVDCGGVPNQEGEELYNKALECRKSEPEKAFKLALRAAKAGNDGAMTYVGAAYLYQGMGGRFEPNQSAYWYEKAANCGIPNAMIQLAGFYMSGVGKEESDSEAKMWLRKAAANTETEYKEAVEQAKGWLECYEDLKEFRKALMESAIEQGGIPQNQ